MKEVRRAVQEMFHLSLNTDQIRHLGHTYDSNFDLEAISGYGHHIVIPRKVAVECLLSQFTADEKLLEFVAFAVSRQGTGGSGGIIQLKGFERIVALARKENWIFDEGKKQFVRGQSNERTSDWGFLKEGQEYNFALASVDIVSSSNFTLTNVRVDVENTLNELRRFVFQIIEENNGRIWSWQGDGGMIAFHGDDSPMVSLLAMCSLLLYLPIFNITENQLRAENDIRLRIGLNYGSAQFRKETTKIVSTDLKTAQDLEKECGEPNAVVVSEKFLNLLPAEARNLFEPGATWQSLKSLRYYPE